jgi:hypothetical protein
MIYDSLISKVEEKMEGISIFSQFAVRAKVEGKK